MASADVLYPEPALRLPIGQTLYTSYLDTYHRRLKKGVDGPLPDAAGVVSGRRFRGRSTPLKGKGQPPPDKNEQQFVSAKHFVQGRSFLSDKELLVHHEEDTAGLASSRPCLRVGELSFRSSLVGGSVSISTEPQPYKPSKRPGTAQAGVCTRDRVFADGLPADPNQPAVVAYYASLRNEPFACRPTTAPPRLVRSSTEARKLYEQCRAGHASVFQYRHSGGICPDEYKLDARRPDALQVAAPPQPAAKDVFWDARRSYDVNRVRSLWAPTQLA